MTLRLEVNCQNELGESAFWSVASQRVFWVDGFAPTIQSWSPGSRESNHLTLTASPLGMIAETSLPQTIALTDPGGIALVDFATGDRVPLAHPERGREGIGYNDGKVDRYGRLWVSTYDASEVEPRGCLWVLENGRAPRLAESGIPVVNGPGFSPDAGSLYLSDSIGRRVLAYEMRADGTLGSKRVLAQLAGEEGLPDGLTVDSEGCVWVALWDGGRVIRFSPKGERLDVVRLPVPRVTSVAFGGADLCRLFITTARYGLSEADLAAVPESGALFSANAGIPGLAATPLPMPFRCGM